MTERRKLPDGWQWVQLQEVSAVEMGQSPDGSSYNSDGVGIPLLNGPTEFGPVSPTPVQWTTQPTKFAQVGDVLLCVRGATTGRRNIADQSYCIGRGLAAIRGNSKYLLTEFLNFALEIITHDLLSESAGSTFLNLPGDKLKKAKIPLPPIEEQRRIVAVLDERLTAVAQARQAAQAQLMAAKALPAAYLRAIFNSPEAQNWPCKRIGDIAITASGTTPSRDNKSYYQDGTIAWIKTGELIDGVIDSAEEYVTELALSETSLKVLPVDTLLIAMYGQGQTRGRTAILAIPATINQACFAILPNPDLFNPYFLQLWFRHNYLQLRLETENRGGNQPNLNGQILNNLALPLPDTKLQDRIVNDLMDKLKTAKAAETIIANQKSYIETMPAAYLRQAFNGEL